MSGALAGKRILITRAAEQAAKSAELLRSRGAEPVLLPTIELHPPADPAAVAHALRRAATFDWAVFTSANGVAWTWKAIDGAAIDPGPLLGLRLAAIGPGTAAALVARGARVEVVATEKKGEGLARAMLERMKRSERVLLLRAQVARDALPDSLRLAGHPVEVVAVYETRPAAGAEVHDALRALEAGALDAVTFTSASTVDSFVALVGGAERARALLSRAVVASIGPITSDALAVHGLRVDVTARDATLEGLMAALESPAARIGHV